MDRMSGVDVVSSPIDVPEKWIQTVDENVEASEFSQFCQLVETHTLVSLL
jgi:hypothetical protein